MSSTEPEPEPGASPGTPPGDDAPTGEMRIVTTTARTPHQAAGRHAADTHADDPHGTDHDPAAERGSLAIEDVVVEKVAAAAAAEVDHVGGVARRVLGVPTGREDGDGSPRASAKVSRQVVALEVRLSVTYPASVRATTEAVRAHVRDRVQALTELTVTRVDVSVAALTATAAPSGKRVIA